MLSKYKRKNKTQYMYFKQHFYVCIDIIVSFNLTQFWPLTISPFTCCFTYILYTSSSSSSNKFLEWERVLLSAVFCQGKYQVLTALVLMFGYFMIDSEKKVNIEESRLH